jgi:transcriptional regulator with XRE-family HTH domain
LAFRPVAAPRLPHTIEYGRLGHALAVIRRKGKLTQAQAASLAQVRPNFLSEVERGRRGLRYHNLVVLVRDVYRSSMSELAQLIEDQGA